MAAAQYSPPNASRVNQIKLVLEWDQVNGRNRGITSRSLDRRVSEQAEPPETRVTVPTDDDVVVDNNA